jgi:Chaperone of endosialidase
MLANHVSKSLKPVVGAAVLALALSVSSPAQNVGIGFSNPLSKLTVNGNFAVGTDYNLAAPTNGALIEGFTCIGTTAPDPGATGANDPFLTVASSGNANITLRPSTNAPSTRAGIFFGDNTYLECTDSTTNGNKDLTFFNIGTQTNVLTLAANNNVGIGTAAPLAPLHVAATGSPVFHPSGSPNVVFFNYLNTNALLTVTTYSAGNQPVSALFASNVWSNSSFVSYSGTFTNSDARLKNIIGRSDSAKDLQTLEKIEVTDYTMKDVIKFGNKPFKKVIAQQVEKVYPAAVTSGGIKGFTFTPDIYAVSESVKIEKPGVYNISLAEAHHLKEGDTVRLITYKNPELNVVAHIVNDKTFTVETKEPVGEKVFVYGKQCTDLKAVDYDAISMLNVSATQEIAKKVQALEQENSELKADSKRLSEAETKITEQDQKIARLEAANAKLTAIAAKMESLEKTVSTMQEKENGLQKAALEQ